MLSTNPKYLRRQTVIASLPPGLYARDVAERLEENDTIARKWCRRFGYALLDARHARSGSRLPRLEERRRKKVLRRCARGRMSLAKVGRTFGVCRERARQLYKEYGIPRTDLREARKAEHRVSLPRLRRNAGEKKIPRQRLASMHRVAVGSIERLCRVHRIPLISVLPGERKRRKILSLLKRGLAHCYVCRRDKPIREFYRSTSRPNGRQSACISCHKEIVKRSNGRA